MDELALLDAQAISHLERFFHVVAVAHQQGQQTVDRSELEATILAHEAATGKPVFTDSQYVLDTLSMLREITTISLLHKKPHYDLLCRWHFLIWDLELETPTIKVKAHQSLTNCEGFERALRIGNHFADSVVKAGVAALHPSYQQMVQTMKSQHKEDRLHFQKQLELRADLAKFRKQLEQSKPPPPISKQSQQLQCLSHWSCDPAQTFELAEDELEAVAVASKWGLGFSEMVLRWLGQLRWPQDYSEDVHDPGITWIELTHNFWICSQQSIPLPVNKGKDTDYVQYERIAGWTKEQCVYSDFVHQFQQRVTHLQTLTMTPLMPPRTRQLIGSLYQLGAGVFKRGFKRRPTLPCADVTMMSIMDYIQQNKHNGKTHFDQLPTIPSCEPTVSPCLGRQQGDTPADRLQRYHARRQFLRAQ